MATPENPVFLVPLSKLVPSAANVRRTGRGDNISELAASIAAHGLLQNLTVASVTGADGKDTGKFEVVAGNRRLAALKLLAKNKRILKSHPVPCALATADWQETSLAENLLQAPMHPADQYEAFARLNARGMAAEDIAGRFGVTATVVKQRLRLGAVSPKLMETYREGGLTLEQLMAFTITDDHALQERVLSELTWNKTVLFIRRALTEGHVEADDRRARYVGLEAYAEAGGEIVKDLFHEAHEGWLADANLLDRLVRQKLSKDAAAVKAEGWAWVAAEPEFHYAMAAGMRRVYPQEPSLSAVEQEKLDALRAEYEAMCEGHDSADELPAEVVEQLEKLEDALDRAQGEPVYAAEDIARCGAFVFLDQCSGLRIERGYLRREDEPESAAASSADQVKREADPNGDGEDNEPCRPLSERVATELSAYRTQALQARLAADSGVAVVALIHALALQTFYRHARLSCLDIDLRPTAFGQFDANMAQTRAGQDLEAAQAAAGAMLPTDPEDLWAFLASQQQDALLALLAVLIAPCCNAITAGSGQEMTRKRAGDALADALCLDITAYWTATADGYFARLSKAQIVAAVREGASESEAQRIEGLKKAQMADAAEVLLAGQGWLPEPLRPERRYKASS